MQQIYRKTPLLNCDINKVALQLYWSCFLGWVFSCKFAAYCQNIFSLEHLWTADSEPSSNISDISSLWRPYATTQQKHQRWINVGTTLIVNVHQRCFSVDIWFKMKVEPTHIYQCWFNAGKITLKQQWFNVDEAMLFQSWHLVEKESWADLCLSTLFQSWRNNVEIILKKLSRSNVDDPMSFQLWYLVENESRANVCSSTLLRSWENSIETILSIFFVLTFTRKWLIAK